MSAPFPGPVEPGPPTRNVNTFFAGLFGAMGAGCGCLLLIVILIIVFGVVVSNTHSAQ